MLTKTHVVDEDGMPLRVYRGEHGEDDTFPNTHLPSIAFGSLQCALHYAKNPNRPDLSPEAIKPRVNMAYLAINRPFCNQPRDAFIDYADLEKAVGELKARHWMIMFNDRIMQTDAWAQVCTDTGTQWPSVFDMMKAEPARLNDLCLSVYDLLDHPLVVHRLKLIGFDGAIYGGIGCNGAETEYRVFYASQIVRYHVIPL